MYMLRLGRLYPEVYPWIFGRLLGPIRTETFLARPAGHRAVPRPLMFGQKFSFKPRRWLEVGFGRTITLGGDGGDAFTFGNLASAYVGRDRNQTTGDTTNPGDERNELSWILYLPGYAMIYADGFIDDTFAYAHPTWAVWRGGIYLARLPKISKADVRVEFANSEALGDIYRDESPGRNYWNFEYRDGHTNNGVLMGNTVGRMGRTWQVRSNYWFSPRHRLELAFKNSSIHREFTPGGAKWQDYGVRHEVHFHSGVYVKSWVQVESIGHHPTLFDGSRRNVTAALELGFVPTGANL